MENWGERRKQQTFTRSKGRRQPRKSRGVKGPWDEERGGLNTNNKGGGGEKRNNYTIQAIRVRGRVRGVRKVGRISSRKPKPFPRRGRGGGGLRGGCSY